MLRIHPTLLGSDNFPSQVPYNDDDEEDNDDNDIVMMMAAAVLSVTK